MTAQSKGRNQRAEWLLEAMEMVFQKGQGLWAHSLLDALEGLTYEQAAWKPRKKGTRSIWGIVNHINYWKELVAWHLKSEGSVEAEDDWPPVTKGDAETWRKAVRRLKRNHNAIIKGLRAHKELLVDLDRPCYLVKGQTAPWGDILYGLIAHDCYHTGQILMLRQLQGIGLE